MSSQPAFRLFGFPVHVRSGFYLFMIVVVVANGRSLGVWLAAFMALLTLLHELGHALAARAAGARAEISLDFLAGYAAYVPTRPLRPWERAGISVSGPAIQIGVSSLALIVMGHHPLYPGHDASDAVRALWWAGPVIGLFNLLPILPLDGGHIVLAGLDRFFPQRSKLVMLYLSMAITIGGGLWLLSQPRFGTFAIYAAIFPLMAQLQMLRSYSETKQPSGVIAAGAAETAAWNTGDLSLLIPGQDPSPWYRASLQLRQGDADAARATLVQSFAGSAPPRWVAPDAADVPMLDALVALLPRPLPTGNAHAEHVLAGILLRVGQYDAAAHYAAASYHRAQSPVAALLVARAAAALQDQETAVGWLRVAEGLSSPAWMDHALRQSPELLRLGGGV